MKAQDDRSEDSAPQEAPFPLWLVVLSVVLVGLARLSSEWTGSSPVEQPPSGPSRQTSPAAFTATPAQTPPPENVSYGPKLTLVGVIVSANPEHSSASISIEDGPQRLIKTRREIYPGATLERVDADRVIVVIGSRHETILMQRSTALQSPPPSHAKTADGMDSRPLRDVRIQKVAGGGFAIQEVETSSVYDQLGLQPRDVVYDVDKLLDLQYPSEAVQKFKDSVVQLEVFRDGQLIHMSYRID